MQNLIERNDTDMARALLKSQKRVAGEAEREENFQRLKPKYLTKDGKRLRRDWYEGNLFDLAKVVGLGPEGELLQRQLSGAVHSTPTTLLAGGSFQDPEHLLLVGWKIMFRVLGRIAHHHCVGLGQEEDDLVRDSMRCIFAAPKRAGGE
jgi:uncharacterized protein DUF5677